MEQIEQEPALAGAQFMATVREGAACDQCGNVYDKSFQLVALGKIYTFDCFECAIARIAPRCDHCEVRIIGHGLESSGRMFCCDHCAEMQGVTSLRDRS
jgi:hypothetical protein